MRGLTLVEVLVAMGVSVVVGALLMVIIVNSTGLFLKQSSKIEQGVGVNDALSVLRSTIRQAQSIDPVSSSTKLVLKLTSIDSQDNLIPDTFDDFIFFQEGNKLRFQTVPNPASARAPVDQILAANVEILDFKYTNPGTVKISLSLKENTATSEASLRND